MQATLTRQNARNRTSTNLSGGVEGILPAHSDGIRHATSETTGLPVVGIRARTAGERLVKSDQHSGSSAPPAQNNTLVRAGMSGTELSGIGGLPQGTPTMQGVTAGETALISHEAC